MSRVRPAAYLRLARGLGLTGSYRDLRHFYATALIAAGVDAGTASRRLGHSSVAFTPQRYFHAGTDSGRRAADAFARLVRGPGEAVANAAS